jgi:pyrroline-5-carboxylate reductase
MTPQNIRTLGFVGTGTITKAVVTGLRTSGHSCDIVVSPRNADVADALARTFDRISVAGTNQAVIDASDVVFLAVRPQIAARVLAELQFHQRQHVISLIATYSRQQIGSMLRGAGKVVCAVPQPTVAMMDGPTVIFPRDPIAASLFGRLGHVVETDSEDAFHALFAATAAMASYFHWLDASSSWLESKGLAAAQARQYVAAMFHGLGGVPLQSDLPFKDLAGEFKTRGGLNEQLADKLTDSGVFEAYRGGLDAILDRVARGAKPRE